MYGIYSSCSCSHTLECQDEIIDLRFELYGEIIALVLHQKGLFFYDTQSFQYLGQCK
jgi:hypothetical protein